MEQRLRLVQGWAAPHRASARPSAAASRCPGQIVWKDAKGTTRIAAVVTRDVSEHGVSVDCLGGMPIPLFRLVYFQVDREARDAPGPAGGAAQVERAVGGLPRRTVPAGDRRPERVRACGCWSSPTAGRGGRRRPTRTSRQTRTRLSTARIARRARRVDYRLVRAPARAAATRPAPDAVDPARGRRSSLPARRSIASRFRRGAVCG